MQRHQHAVQQPQLGQPAKVEPKAGDGTAPAQLACVAVDDKRSFLRGRLDEDTLRGLIMDATEPSAELMRDACAPGSAKRLNHTVLFINRLDTTNAFHNMENLAMVFMAMAVAQRDERGAVPVTNGVQVIVLDDKEVGSYMDIWQRLSHPHPVLQLSQTPLPEGVCLPHVLASPFVDHAISLFTYQNSHATDVQCSSVELRGLSLWLRYLYRNLMPPGAAYAATRAAVQQHQQRSTPQLWSWLRSNAMHGRLLAASDAQQLALAAALEGAAAGARAQHARMLQQLHSAPQVPGVRHVGVLWISRAHFEASMEGKLTTWQNYRRVGNEVEVILALQKAVLEWNARACLLAPKTEGCRKDTLFFDLEVVEMSDLPFQEQLVHMLRMGVLVGVHGAGLTNMIFMPPGLGSVVEVWHGMSKSYHYHNMAHHLGHTYHNLRSPGGDISAELLVGEVIKAMDDVHSKMAAAGKLTPRSRPAWLKG